MPDQFKTAAKKVHVQAGSFGNVSVAHAQRNLNGVANADVVFFFLLPRGSLVYDSILQKTGDAAAVGATMKLGLQAAGDGSLGDDDFFNAAKALDGADSINRKDNAAPPLVLDDDYYVIGTVGGANVGANDTLADVTVTHEYRGNL